MATDRLSDLDREELFDVADDQYERLIEEHDPRVQRRPRKRNYPTREETKAFFADMPRKTPTLLQRKRGGGT